MRRILFLYSLSFFFTVTSNAQPAKELEVYFREVKKDKNLLFPKSLTDPANAETVLNFIKPYLNDTSSFIRSKSVQLMAMAGRTSKNATSRKKAVQSIAGQWRKSDPSFLLSLLKKFQKEDFELAIVDSLLHFLDSPTTQKSSLIRLIGFAGSSSAIEKLRKFSSKENTQSVRWSAMLAMTRLGDEEVTTSVLEKAKKLKVNDEAVNQLFPDLVYTRNKQVFDYLVEVINSDQPSCESADNDNPTSILCGYRVMEQLAPVINNYPLTLDASGDVKTKDYKQALETVRQWFQKNTAYTINKSTY
jgi:hypothetical protein